VGQVNRRVSIPNGAKKVKQMTTVICKTCGKQFSAYKSRILRGDSKFCSRECYLLSHKTKESFCKECQKPIKSYNGKVFCSDECRKKYGKKMVICLVCGKIQYLKPSLNNRLYCSVKCRSIAQSGNEKSEHVEINCEFCGKVIRIRKKHYDLYGKRYCSQECYSKSQINPDRESFMRDRDCDKMKDWRNSIFARDNYICQKCHKKGGKLNAHHIIPFSVDEGLRFEPSNGITLCKECHKKTHLQYSKKMNLQATIFDVRYKRR
jgi:5-methylcytosine-specific restriction endonuclease McrA/endogenous inhibitor of DNA gyrase (YacG/DUF329 family)